jgi:hypothetical protein
MARAGLRDGWAERSARTTEPSPSTETIDTEPATGIDTEPATGIDTEPATGIDPEPGAGSTAATTPAPGGTASRADPWPTNWRGWRPGTTKLPTQQLDYVYASAAIASLTVHTPTPGVAGFERFATLSDHLPITAEIELP